MKRALVIGMVWALPVFADVNVGESINHDKTAQNFASCPANFYQGQAPVLVGNKGKKLGKNTYELCFDGFAVLYSGVSRTPIWSAEHLTKARVLSAKNLAREDSFHAESRLPESVRAELSDYSRSGYDRGHLAPNGDMATKSQQFDSFSLANIAPQNGTHNRNTWRNIESATRSLAVKYGEVYVVTGALFLGKDIATIGTGVLVPSHFFKAVYIPSIDKSGVYYSINGENHDTKILSTAAFSAKTGIDPFANLSQDTQSVAFELPMTAETDSTDTAQKKQSDSEQVSGWVAVVIEILKFLVSIFK